MSEIINNEFEQSVSVYLKKCKVVLKGFMNGVIELGEILSQQRDKWKPQGKWYQYLKEIDLSESHAGVQIRAYEYALNDRKTLMEVHAQNFRQLQKFLSLGDDQKKLLAESVDGKELSTGEFMNKVEQISCEALGEFEGVEVPDEDDDEITLGDMSFNMRTRVEFRQDIDIPWAAEQILKGMQLANEIECSQKSLPVIEGFLHTELSMALIEKYIHKLKPGELNYWKGQLTAQAERLSKLIHSIELAGS